MLPGSEQILACFLGQVRYIPNLTNMRGHSRGMLAGNNSNRCLIISESLYEILFSRGAQWYSGVS